jgi:AcrR family transcriptional regulator
VSKAGEAGKEESPGLRPLHGGRHSVPPELVAFNQRERLLAALASIVAERGYAKTTIAQITEAAAVSRRTFYENFADKQECFLAAFDALDSHLERLMIEAAGSETDWPDRVAAVLLAMMRFFASRPQFARLYLVEAAGAGEATAERREKRAKRLIDFLAAGRQERSQDRELPEGLEEAIGGGIITLLFRRVRAGEAEQLERFAPGVIEFALTPYLGPDQARALALSRTSPPPA